MKQKQYLSAEEAAKALGISRATLYAYVSRGMIYSEPAGEGTRVHRYDAEDVRRLQRRQAQREDPAAAAAQALHFGAPVLESALTLIEEGRFYYRGADVLRLAREAAVEVVIALLWTGSREPAVEVGRGVLPALLDKGERALPAITRFQAALPLAAMADLEAYDLRPAAVVETGRRILGLLVTVAAGVETGEGPVVARLRAGWGLPASAEPLLRAILILCADHELNVSTFTARCVASAGGSPYQVVAAGLTALEGQHHGGYTRRVEALWREVGAPEAARSRLAGRLRRGEAIPGFGHRLYPEGDPRARLLLEMVAAYAPEAPAVALAEELVSAAGELVGERPVLDFALVAATRVLALPADSALTLFALGRTIGWIAHALEQYEREELIRPRARYVGPAID